MFKYDMPLTLDFIAEEILFFKPNTEAEAKEIQECLFKMGCVWPKAGKEEQTQVQLPDYCVQRGIVVNKGALSLFTGYREELEFAYHCTLDQLKEGIALASKPVRGEVNEAALKEARQDIDSMIGLGQAKKDTAQTIALARIHQAKIDMGLKVEAASMHMVFTGNPGTGKTTFARKVAKLYHALGFIESDKVVEVKRKDVVAGYIGQTAKAMEKKIKEATGGVLFIDEAYALVREKNSDGKDFGHEAIETLVAEMENLRDRLVVIVAGYPEDMKRLIESNAGLESRFINYISFEDYSIGDLGLIMDQMCEMNGCRMQPAARKAALELLEDVKKSTDPRSFGNARAVRNLVEKALKTQAERLDKSTLFNEHASGQITDGLFKLALATITPADIANISLKDIKTAKEEQKRGIGFTAKWPEEETRKLVAVPAAANM